MTTDTPAPDPHDRVCCPDDFCTGILDQNGTCGTCDRTYSQYASSANKPAPHDESPEENQAVAVDTRQDTDEANESAEASTSTEVSSETRSMEDFSPDDRIVCPDDMCTGVIGPDGHCGTCGISGAP